MASALAVGDARDHESLHDALLSSYIFSYSIGIVKFSQFSFLFGKYFDYWNRRESCRGLPLAGLYGNTYLLPSNSLKGD